MRAEINVPDELGAEALNAALEGLVELGVADLRRGMVGGHVPTLYTSGVRYERERGTERWLTPSQVLAAHRRGRGSDCEDLAAWRAAECRVSGEDPGARAIVRRSGPRTWHAIVEHSDGTLEDPSRILGMGSTELGSLRDWNVTLRREGDSWIATLSRGGEGVSGRAEYGHDALDRACRIAQGLAGSELGLPIPGLDMLARVAQGALQAALPPPPPGGMPMLPPGIPGAVPTGEGIDAAARRITQQIQRIATAEARRKLTAAQRAVSGEPSSRREPRRRRLFGIVTRKRGA